MLRAIYWDGDAIAILDQRVLPQRQVTLRCTDARQVIKAIRTMAIRGAPAIGIAGAMALALEARRIQAADPQTFRRKFLRVCRLLKQARPTAVNLAWAVDRMYAAVSADQDADVFALQRRVRQEADALAREDLQVNETLARIGGEIVPKGARMLTYCNTGTLATGGHGTALGVIRTAFAADRSLRVFACETRPVLQGARLTSFELMAEGIPVTLITDNAAGALMARNGVDLVLVGADRIAANGDTANKIGTYNLSLAAYAMCVRFYVVGPTSTIDMAIPDGDHIPVEERGADEVTHIEGTAVAPTGAQVFNPAFDVTPSRYITGIITEKGIISPSFKQSLKTLFN
ncbi:MAG TPA: S-methyl-5-thioribose-1-phosphate isomerase [Syntrophobacteraceae bacterium]|nr:S-methyl-5-thioribose-1-phosphate isomerase [Syntrophobacteraceae bacterium]